MIRIGWLRNIKWFIQRGRRGWADCDTWGLDHYLAGVIAGSVEHLRATTHSYPCPYFREPAPENHERAERDWDTTLEAISVGFWIMARDEDAYENGEAVDFDDVDWAREIIFAHERPEVRRAMHLFAANFGSLWD